MLETLQSKVGGRGGGRNCEGMEVLVCRSVSGPEVLELRRRQQLRPASLKACQERLGTSDFQGHPSPIELSSAGPDALHWIHSGGMAEVPLPESVCFKVLSPKRETCSG